MVATASYASHVDTYAGMPAYTIASQSSFDLSKPWTTQIDVWEFPRNCSQLHRCHPCVSVPMPTHCNIYPPSSFSTYYPCLYVPLFVF